MSRNSIPEHDDQFPTTPTPRRYDSFVVRLWTDVHRTILLRAEVHHVQSGLVERQTEVTISWVQQAIAEFLGPSGNDET